MNRIILAAALVLTLASPAYAAEPEECGIGLVTYPCALAVRPPEPALKWRCVPGPKYITCDPVYLSPPGLENRGPKKRVDPLHPSIIIDELGEDQL